MKRREFLPGILAAALGTQLPLALSARETGAALPLPQPDDPDFWEGIRAQFRTGNLINLNNGAVSPQPLPVEEAFFNYYRIANDTPSIFLRRALDSRRELSRQKLARLAGCPEDEIAINRNATEALVTIIMGLPLKQGDEVVLSKFDYPSMLNAWRIREQREGIKLVWANPEAAGADNASVVDDYVSRFTHKTRVVHITHMINWTGRLVPAQDIVAAARRQGIVTIVDAAHTLAHVPFSITELNCDYLGASLHKWLCAPFGSGMIYVKKENIRGLPSLFPTEPELFDSIKKYEELGTRNFAVEAAVGEAVDFHQHIGGRRKFDRLVELRNHWIDQVRHHPKIKIHTPLQADMAGAIAMVELEGRGSVELSHSLHGRYHIHCSPTSHEGIQGVRISPHVYTQKIELDVLAGALLELAG